MRTFEKFNQSGFSHFMNSPGGRVFRVVAGIFFLAIGFAYRTHWLGIVSMIWSVFPLTAGGFDLCYVSAVLGGPLMGTKIREEQRHPHIPSQMRHHPS